MMAVSFRPGKLKVWLNSSISYPRYAETVAGYLGAGGIDAKASIFQSGQWNEVDLKQILEAIFNWELNVFLKLWGKNWTDEQMLADYKKLSILGKTFNSDLGDWIISNAIVRVLSPLYPSLTSSSLLLDYVEEISLEPDTGSLYKHAIAMVLYQAGYSTRAFDLLELTNEDFPERLISWLALVELYWQSGEIGTALNTIQRAIQAEIVSTGMYVRYAEILLAFDASNLEINVGAQRTSSTGRTFVEDFILIDPDKIKVNRLVYEAVKSYEYALRLEPDNAEILSHLIVQLSDLRDLSLWSQFEKLVEIDQESFHIRNVIEAASSLEDIEPAINILFSYTRKHPNQVQAHINLASVYILDDQNDKARIELEVAQKLSNDQQINSEIQRLLLTADDPGFDERLGVITDLLNAGNKIRPEDVEFLETTIENAPAFATGYVLLANAYLHWDEITDALDVLLDGQRQLPDDPDISTVLATVLWQEGETQLAFDCLNKALAKNPDHVPTLAITGRFLFEDGQEDEARSFLAKAEALDPRNRS